MPPLDAAFNHPALWCGRSCARVAVPGVPTAFPELDAALPGGGWPAGALTEIYVDREGIGEMQLFMPAAARLTGEGRWITLVSPPHVPYAPALAAWGVRLSRVMSVRAPRTEDRFWACEQALQAGGCGAVLAWIDRAPERTLRRLQAAAEGSRAVVLLLRSARVIPASPAALRLHVSRSQSRTVVRVLKRRGGGLPAPILLDLQGPQAAVAGKRRYAAARAPESVS